MEIQSLVKWALQEDLPSGDITTDSLGKSESIGEAHLIAKEDLVFSGKEIFETVLRELEPNARLIWNFNEGDLVLDRQVIAVIEGNLLQILKAERVALNFLGRLSGIATLTRCFVKRTEGTECRILDTRKTTPGFRKLEKLAVQHGGGTNHRMNLSDGILLKENHLHVAGGIRSAVEKIRQKTTDSIEVEVKNLDEVREASELDIQRVMLDNMSTEEMREALTLIPASVQTEASGNMTIERINEVAQLGVNFISVGALTHSAPCADVSLLFFWDNDSTPTSH